MKRMVDHYNEFDGKRISEVCLEGCSPEVIAKRIEHFLKGNGEMNVLIIAGVLSDKSVGALRMTSLARFLINKGVNLWVLTNKRRDKDRFEKAQYVFC